MKTYNVSLIKETEESIIEHGDGEKWGRRDCTHQDHTILGIRLSKQSYNRFDLLFKPKRDTEYYLLYVLYKTGDSFGYDTGRFEAINIYKDKNLAEYNKTLILAHYKKYKESYDYTSNENEESIPESVIFSFRPSALPFPLFVNTIFNVAVSPPWITLSPS